MPGRYPFSRREQKLRPALEFMVGGAGASSMADSSSFLSTFSADIKQGNWFFLNNDGTSAAGGLALTAIGSPITQTLATPNNGAFCANYTSQRLSTTARFETATSASPAGSFSVGILFRVEDLSANRAQIYQGIASTATDHSFYLRVTTGGALQLGLADGSTTLQISSAATVVTPRAWHFAMATYSRVGGAANNVVKLYIDGVQSGSTSSVALLVPAVTRKYTVGANETGTLTTSGRVGFAFVSGALLDSSVAAMATAAIGANPTFANGTALTVSRASPITVPSAADWTQVGVIPAGRAGLTLGGILCAPAATNLCLRSEEFDNASWTKAATTISPNGATCPDGSLTYDKIAEDNTTAQHAAFQGVTVTTATVYTYSLWLKSAERTWAYISFAGAGFGGSTHGVFVNLTTGVLGSTPGTGIAGTVIGGSVSAGWRVAITKTSSGTAGALQVHTATADGGTTVPNYAGSTGSGIYVWGAQVETGAVATPYIRTEASTVARVVGVYSIAKPATVTDTEGSASCSFRALGAQAAVSSSIVSFGASGVPIAGNATDNTGLRILDGTNTISKSGLVSMFNRAATVLGQWFGATLSVEEVGTAAATGSYDGTMTAASLYLGSSNGSTPTYGVISDVKIDGTKDGAR